jgi:uncharacterized protein DUF262/uncharacterized protein DUF1524
MGRVRIHGAEYPIKKIFSDDFVFNIPLYQRPYAWTTEHAGELLDDLIAFMGDSKEPIEADELTPYFLGSIVLIKGDEPDAQVVDGQQRLTTLAILLATLRALIPSESAKDLTPFLYEKGNAIAGTSNRYRLTLRERDAQFFQKYIQNEKGIEKLNELNQATLSDSQKNIYDNTQLFLQYLQKLSDMQRLALAQFVVNRCFLVVVSTPDLDSAYRIFSVLNDRGLDLSHTDILKAEIIGKVPPQAQDKYSSKWEDLEISLGREIFENLFVNIRTIYRKVKPKGTILEEFREYVYPTRKPYFTPQEFIDDVLLPYAAALDTITTADYQGSKHSKEINILLKWLNRIDNSNWIPPAMLFFSRNQNNPDMLLRFFAYLERLAASFMIRKSNINKRIERYGRLMQLIERGDDVFGLNSPIYLLQGERRETYEILNGDIYLVRGISQYALQRLDAALSDGTASYDYPIITVEHVLPQNPAINSEWMRYFPSKEEHDKYVHRLGNLVLLSRRKNTQAQNYDFALKKQRYFTTGQSVSPFALTTQVLHYSAWTPGVIEQRQQALMNLLVKIWAL